MKKRKILLIVFVLLNACDSKEDQKLTHFIEDTLQHKAQYLPKSNTPFRLNNFNYPKTGTRRNPFKPPHIGTPLKEMRYVGSLKQGNTLTGLLALPRGEVILVQQGEILAQHHGKIIQLDEATMVIKQYGKIIRLQLAGAL